MEGEGRGGGAGEEEGEWVGLTGAELDFSIVREEEEGRWEGVEGRWEGEEEGGRWEGVEGRWKGEEGRFPLLLWEAVGRGRVECIQCIVYSV